MFEVLYKYDPGTTVLRPMPATPEAARHELTSGNQTFAEILERASAGIPTGRQIVNLAAKDLGLAAEGDEAPEQLPFAAVLSCADARVPVEMVMLQQANDLFVVRIAGNVPGPQSIGKPRLRGLPPGEHPAAGGPWRPHRSAAPSASSARTW